eukprot:355308-Chlamydomonas_euryale.AAC.2
MTIPRTRRRTDVRIDEDDQPDERHHIGHARNARQQHVGERSDVFTKPLDLGQAAVAQQPQQALRTQHAQRSDERQRECGRRQVNDAHEREEEVEPVPLVLPVRIPTKPVDLQDGLKDEDGTEKVIHLQAQSRAQGTARVVSQGARGKCGRCGEPGWCGVLGHAHAQACENVSGLSFGKPSNLNLRAPRNARILKECRLRFQGSPYPEANTFACSGCRGIEESPWNAHKTRKQRRVMLVLHGCPPPPAVAACPPVCPAV